LAAIAEKSSGKAVPFQKEVMLKLLVQIEEQEFTILSPASQTVKWLALASCQRYMGSALPRGEKGRRGRTIPSGFVLPSRVLHPRLQGGEDVHLEPCVILGDIFQLEDRAVVKLNGNMDDWKPSLRCKSRGVPILTRWNKKAFRNGPGSPGDLGSSEEFAELSLTDRINRYHKKVRAVSMLASSLGTYFESQASQHKADIVEDFKHIKLDFVRPSGAKANVATNECKNIIGEHFGSLQSCYSVYAAASAGSVANTGINAHSNSNTTEAGAPEESATILAFEGLNKLFGAAKVFNSRAQQRATMIKLRAAVIQAHHLEETGQDAVAEARRLAHNRKYQLSLTRPQFLEALMRVGTWLNGNTDTDLGFKTLLEKLKPVFSDAGRQHNNPVRVQLRRPQNQKIMAARTDEMMDIVRCVDHCYMLLIDQQH
jgi:hypothetical protein